MWWAKKRKIGAGGRHVCGPRRRAPVSVEVEGTEEEEGAMSVEVEGQGSD